MIKLSNKIPLYRGKLTNSPKVKQNVWVGWVTSFEDGRVSQEELGTFNTLQELKNSTNQKGE